MWPRSRSILPLVLWPVLLGLPFPVFAQQAKQKKEKQEKEEAVSPQKVEERRHAAETAPLFASQDPLAVTLRTDIKLLRDKRPDKDDVEGTLAFAGPDGHPMTVPVKVRTRGNFRRGKANCNFPPLRLNLTPKSVKGTVFEGQNKLKLVTPCQDSRNEYQQYVLQEYLVYKVYQLLTPASFRVRLLHITYEDVNGAYDTRTKTAFVIEDEKAMAERNGGQVVGWESFNPTGPEDARAAVQVLATADQKDAVMTSLFEFMIGNTDVSLAFLHNAVLISTGDGRHEVVPYDFDWSGVVDARYAHPDARLGINSVRDRLYRGFCRPGIDPGVVAERFERIRDSIPPLYQGVEGLDAKERDQALKYYDSFYDILRDPKRFDREVVKACRQVG
jgi:hypothetical protein